MRMSFVIFFIIFMLLIFVFVVGIVYWAISHANKKNKEQLAFATAHGYQFDQAQGRDNYRDYSSRTMSSTLTITPTQSLYVENMPILAIILLGVDMREKLPMSSLVSTMGSNSGLSLIILEAMQSRVQEQVVSLMLS